MGALLKVLIRLTLVKQNPSKPQSPIIIVIIIIIIRALQQIIKVKPFSAISNPFGPEAP